MKRNTSAGFTLVELLVVIALLVCLVAVLSPALAKTKPNGQAAQCLNNLRQLTAAWRMYAEDNNDGLVYNTDGGATGIIWYNASWVGGWLDNANLFMQDNTDTNKLINHSDNPNAAGPAYFYCAYLGPYLKTASVFRCPADPSTGLKNGQIVPRVRSFSMNNYVGALSRTWLGAAAGPGVSSAQRQGASVYPLVTKSQDFTSPANSFIFMDEQEGSINDGCFFTDPDTSYQLIEFPASRHGWSAGLSFADGHSEIHRWRDARTVPIIGAGQILSLNIQLPGDMDVVWLANHAVGKP